MGKILHLAATPPAKLGFERVKVKKGRKKDPEKHGQMNLFSPASDQHPARIVSLPSRFSPFEAALLLDERGDKNAAESYGKAISKGDSVADAYCNLGILESKAGKSEKAFDCFTQSLKEDPRHLEAHYNLANLYFDMDNLRLAQQHYEIATQIEPKFPNIYFNLGLVLAINEDLQEAVDVLGKYQELVPEEESCKADELLASLKSSLAVQK